MASSSMPMLIEFFYVGDVLVRVGSMIKTCSKFSVKKDAVPDKSLAQTHLSR